MQVYGTGTYPATGAEEAGRSPAKPSRRPRHPPAAPARPQPE